MKIDLPRKEIDFAASGMLMRKVVDKNITNVPSKLKMNIGVDHVNRQFHGSVANILVLKEGDITEISAEPCKKREGTLLPWNPELWKIVGPRWLLTEEYKEIICTPYEQYNLAIPSAISLDESMDLCKEKLNNSIIPYPENPSTFLKYVAWYDNTTAGACSVVWTPLSDQNSEGVFLNMNNNSTVQYEFWDKKQPNGGKDQNYVGIIVRNAALNDIDKSELACSTCSLPSSLFLQLDGVCKDSFIGNILPLYEETQL